MYRILTVNAHTGYMYLLSKLDCTFDVLLGWDDKNRDKPSNMTLIDQKEAEEKIKQNYYDIVLVHRRFHDLPLIVKSLMHKTPVILTFHGKNSRGPKSVPYQLTKKLFNNFIIKPLNKFGNLSLDFIQPAVKASFGMEGFAIEPGIDINDFYNWEPKNNNLLIVGNDLNRTHFDYDTILKLNKDFDTVIFGQNPPELANSKPADSFEELKCAYRDNFVYVNLLKEPECGYNLATLEAMATGMPVITLKHPESPIKNNYNGLVVKNCEELKNAYNELINNKAKAVKLGEKAKETIKIYFNMEDFKNNWMEAIGSSINKSKGS